MKKNIFYAIFSIYIIMVLLFFLDIFTPFEIMNQFVKNIIWANLLFGSIVIFISVFFAIKAWKIRIIYLLPVIITVFLCFMINPMRILWTSSIYETKAILYKHKHSPNRAIELQWQDIGALGFNRREVEVIYLSKLFAIIKNVPDNIDEKTEWEGIEDEIIIE